MLKDARSNVADERERHLTERLRQRAAEPVDSKPLTAEDKQELAKKEYNKLLSARSGGTYVPPARLRALQSQVTDKASKEYQRMAWEALKKSINGLVNKINVGNIKNIVPELFGENLIRGKGKSLWDVISQYLKDCVLTSSQGCFAEAFNAPRLKRFRFLRCTRQW